MTPAAFKSLPKYFVLREIVKTASEAYDKHEPNLVEDHFTEAGTVDNLARFVANELVETFDPEQSRDDQFKTAAEALWRVSQQLRGVAEALEDEMYKRLVHKLGARGV